MPRTPKAPAEEVHATPSGKNAAKAWGERRAENRRLWLSRVEQTVRACLAAENATPEQRKIARSMRGLIRAYKDAMKRRRYAEAAYEAFQMGLCYERIRTEPLAAPAAHAEALGGVWRGHWLPLTGLERRIVVAVGDHTEVPYIDFVRAVWGRGFGLSNRGARSRVDKALSDLNRKLAATDDVIHIRGESVIVEARPIHEGLRPLSERLDAAGIAHHIEGNHITYDLA